MIIDHIENLTIQDNDEFAKLTLARLSQGLFWLNDSVSEAEIHVRNNANKENVKVGIVNGVLKNVPTDIPIEWISCAFQWYAVSVYDYARLVGWLAYKDIEKAREYVNRVLPRVSIYRHKVAAHFAITDPRKEDNIADLTASIITNTVYAKGFLLGGAMSEILSDEKGKEIEKSYQTSWSLTKKHEGLRKRYWPDGPLQVIESIKVPAKTTRRFRIDYPE